MLNKLAELYMCIMVAILIILAIVLGFGLVYCVYNFFKEEILKIK